MRNILTIAHLTLHEARRRRIVVAAAICGVAFLAVYATGVSVVSREMDDRPFLVQRVNLVAFSMLGMFAVNVLVMLFAILLPIDALSGEIDSGVIQTIAAKPIRRPDIVLGKWLGHAAIVVSYLLALILGVLLVLRLITGYAIPNLASVVPLMSMEAARRGKHIFCQKPLALSVEESKALRDTVQRHRVAFQLGAQQRSSAPFRFAVELVRNGRIGQLQTIAIGSAGGGQTALPLGLGFTTMPADSSS